MVTRDRGNGAQGPVNIEAPRARLREQWEIRLNNQCFLFSPLNSTNIKEAPLSCWLNNCHPISGTGDNGGKKPKRPKKNEKKHIFHTTILEWWGSRVTAPNQLLTLPFSTRCSLKGYPWSSCSWEREALVKSVCGCVSTSMYRVPILENRLHQETDDSHSLRLNCVTSVTAFTPVL